MIPRIIATAVVVILAMAILRAWLETLPAPKPPTRWSSLANWTYDAAHVICALAVTALFAACIALAWTVTP